MGSGLQYPTLNQHHLVSTSYHSMDDTRNRSENQPTDKLIKNAGTEALCAPPTNTDHLSTVVIDMNRENFSNAMGGGEGVFTPNGNTILNMDLLNANNTLNADRNSNSTDLNNIVEIHSAT